MRQILYKEALNEAIREEMQKDKNIIIFGEDIGISAGAFQVTKDLQKEFGTDRVRDTPISEVAIIGGAIGSALCGLRPIAEIQFNDFLGVAGDQIINQMAKLRFMSGGQLKLPLVVRMPMGAGLSAAAQHSQCLDGIFMNIPGLKIVCPSNPYDAKGLLKSAIRDDNPILFFEYLKLYDLKGEVPDDEYTIPIGKADIKREGKDITIIAISEMVNKSLEVAHIMEKEGIDIEVVDVRTLAPLDFETILESIKKTNKVIIAYNGHRNNGSGAEIAARIADEAFEYLDAPVKRVAAKDIPIPFAPNLESYVIPQKEDLILEIKNIFK